MCADQARFGVQTDAFPQHPACVVNYEEEAQRADVELVTRVPRASAAPPSDRLYKLLVYRCVAAGVFGVYVSGRS